MKNGKTLVELATEIERQKNGKKDYIADTREITFDAFDHTTKANPVLTFEGTPHLITDTCHRQIGERTNIPAKYYDRMRGEAPELLAMNVNHWFHSNPERRMVRTLDGRARALLSDRYQRIDNAEVAEAVLPVLLETPGLRIESCEITERRLYIKAVNEKLEADVRKDDTIQAGVQITNSEIGYGAYSVTPLAFRLWCLNGCTVNDLQYRRNHVGSRASTDEAVYEMLSDEAIKADDQAIMLKARDVVRASLSEALFSQIVSRMRDAAEGVEVKAPVKAVELLANKVGFNADEQNGILTQLIKGGDLTRYGMLNAITRHAQDVDSYDRSTEMEEIGGRILNLTAGQWKRSQSRLNLISPVKVSNHGD